MISNNFFHQSWTSIIVNNKFQRSSIGYLVATKSALPCQPNRPVNSSRSSTCSTTRQRSSHVIVAMVILISHQQITNSFPTKFNTKTRNFCQNTCGNRDEMCTISDKFVVLNNKKLTFIFFNKSLNKVNLTKISFLIFWKIRL